MTLNQAKDKASSNSFDGVQHVNRRHLTNYAEHDCYDVSDWYDWESTVVSYYKGEETL